jgi:hypothetical protein
VCVSACVRAMYLAAAVLACPTGSACDTAEAAVESNADVALRKRRKN